MLCTYLLERRHKSQAAAEALVADLVSVSRQRGGLLEERAGQYRFSHLSFQEFLTARYLAEVERDVTRIATFLEQQNRLADSWWREPILLTGGYLHVTAPDTATDLLRRLAHLGASQPPHTASDPGRCRAGCRHLPGVGRSRNHPTGPGQPPGRPC